MVGRGKLFALLKRTGASSCVPRSKRGSGRFYLRERVILRAVHGIYIYIYVYNHAESPKKPPNLLVSPDPRTFLGNFTGISPNSGEIPQILGIYIYIAS